MARPKTHDSEVAERLIVHASRLIAESGPRALNLRQLARSAETSTSAVYSLFGGKPRLLEAVKLHAFASFAQAQRSVATSDDVFADLMALGHAYRSWALANPDFFECMFSTPSDVVAGQGWVSMDPMVALLDRAIAEGRMAGDSLAIAASLWAACHGWVMLEMNGFMGTDNPREGFEDTLRAAGAGWAVVSLRGQASPAPA